jgi:hypothetical protein
MIGVLPTPWELGNAEIRKTNFELCSLVKLGSCNKTYIAQIYRLPVYIGFSILLYRFECNTCLLILEKPRASSTCEPTF